MPTAQQSTATEIRAGPKSGAASNWARFSISQASANAPSTNTARLCKPTTTPSAHSRKPENTCRRPTSVQNRLRSSDWLASPFQNHGRAKHGAKLGMDPALGLFHGTKDLKIPMRSEEHT